MPEHDLDSAAWRKSSHSGGGGNDCLEVDDSHPTHVPVRDSKNPRGPKLAFRPEAWAAFVEGVKAR